VLDHIQQPWIRQRQLPFHQVQGMKLLDRQADHYREREVRLVAGDLVVLELGIHSQHRRLEWMVKKGNLEVPRRMELEHRMEDIQPVEVDLEVVGMRQEEDMRPQGDALNFRAQGVQTLQQGWHQHLEWH